MIEREDFPDGLAGPGWVGAPGFHCPTGSPRLDRDDPGSLGGSPSPQDTGPVLGKYERPGRIFELIPFDRERGEAWRGQVRASGSGHLRR
jgi:hypothetical protein